MSKAETLHRIMRSRWVTPLDALRLANCLSLSQRCGQLRRQGVNVISKWVKCGESRVKAYRVVSRKGC